MYIELEKFNPNLFSKSFNSDFDSYNSSLIYNLYNIEKANGLLIFLKKQMIASFLPNFFGEGLNAIDLFSINKFSVKEIAELLFYLNGSLEFSKNTIIRHIPFDTLKQIKQKYEIYSITSSSIASPIYPSENEYPHVVYSFSNLNYEYINQKNIGKLSFPVYNTGNFSIYRYTLNRLSRKFINAIYCELSAELYFYTLNSWKVNFLRHLKSHSNIFIGLSEKDFTRFWFDPIGQFWDFYQCHKNSSEFVSNCIKCDDNIGFWIGTIQKNNLFIYVFLSNRANRLFSDLLLLDLISYSIKNKLSKIYLGGSESDSLFKFKKKYINYFPLSYVQQFADIILK